MTKATTTTILALRSTGETVTVLSVRGGWSTIQLQDGAERKVRNGDIETREIAVPAPKAPKAPKAPRERKPIEERLNGVVDAAYLPRYVAYTAVVGGRRVRSLDRGDALAVEWRALTLDEVYARAARILSVSPADLVSRFAHLNPGMQRMSVGNMVRRVLKNGGLAAE